MLFEDGPGTPGDLVRRLCDGTVIMSFPSGKQHRKNIGRTSKCSPSYSERHVTDPGPKIDLKTELLGCYQEVVHSLARFVACQHL